VRQLNGDMCGYMGTAVGPFPNLLSRPLLMIISSPLYTSTSLLAVGSFYFIFSARIIL
jgi:hypothetical protein